MMLENVYKQLELTDEHVIKLSDKNWKSKTVFPSRILKLLEDTDKWQPQAIFCLDCKPLILFFENPANEKELHKAIWNFNETPIVIIAKNNSVDIYNGFAINENTKLLEQLGSGDTSALNDFTYFKLVTGKTFECYHNSFNNKNRVDYKLLQNIEEAQKELCNQYGCSRLTANALLGKVIFIRYLIDRKVKLNFENESKEWTNEDLCNLVQNKSRLYNFFQYLRDTEKGFNGDLFPINEYDFNKIPEQAFDLIRRLLESEDITNGQKSLFQLYDFSMLPIEFISNVYEKFIGKENQAKSGAYYTPPFLVDYIVKETIGKFFKDNPDKNNCKILDPACGSGIFLVEVLRKIIEKNIAAHKNPPDPETLKNMLKQTVQENIFGIDKDKSAIQVAIFSIYLTLLDYQKPAEIENFKFPNLLDTNFFIADFFDTEAKYNQIIEKHYFDFIVGNPPWAGNTKGLDSIGRRYVIERQEKEKNRKKKFKIGINNNELAEGFVFRVSDFCNKKTQTAFIIKSSILYNLGYSDINPFRSYWLQEFFIDKVFELAPVRHEIFDRSNDPAIAPAAIIFYRYAFEENTNDNILEHIVLKPSRFFSLFKIFSITRRDYNKIQQDRLKKYDWLWKTLVYGSYLDFNLLKRLKKEYPTIKKIISDKDKFVEGTGIQYSSKPTYNSEHLIGRSFIASRNIEPFFINPDKIIKFNKKKVHRIRKDKEIIFKAPMLLIRKGLDINNMTMRTVVSKQDLLFKDSITSISAVNPQDINYLYNIQLILTSDILCYYAVNTFAFIGIEREQTQNYDKYSLPYVELNIQKEVEEIEQLKIHLHCNKKNNFFDSIEIEKYNKDISEKIAYLNKEILHKLNLSDREMSLIDYAVNVSRFMFGSKNNHHLLSKAIAINETILQDYAQLYINRFAATLSSNNNKFFVEIWHTDHIIGMFFKTIPAEEFIKDIVYYDKANNQTIIAMIKLSAQQITEKLFIQKDIRGFEKDYFYIFKPNEKRLWHKAIGYIDVDEFADAMFKARGGTK